MPEIALGLGLLAVAAAVLVAGAELFVENLSAAASRLRISVLAVAVLLAGAEPEEAVTSALASAAGRPGLSVGDAVGANITVLGLALGLAAVLSPLPVGRRVRRYAVMSSAAGFCALAVLADDKASRPEGLLLLAAYVVVIGLVWWREKAPPAIGELAEAEAHRGATGNGIAGSASVVGGISSAHEENSAGGRPAVLKAGAGLILMAVGGVAAVFAAELVVAGSGLGDSTVGLTLLALATSAEMLALVLAALRHDVAEIAVAGAVGAAAYNATVSLGVAPLVQPLRVEGFVLPALVAALLPLLVVLLARHGRLGRGGGAVLVGVYLVVVAGAVGG